MSESSLNPDKKLSTLTLVNDHKLSMHLNSISEHVSPSDRARWDNASSGTSSARHAASAKRSAEAAAASAAKAEEIANNITIPDNGDFSNGINVLPLGTQTSLGAPAYGLSVQKDTGLQLWGTHFYVGDVHNDHTLKIMHDSLSLGTTNSAAIGFDYANEVIFRTMPNDGSSANDNAGAIYRFEAWQWADDSHTSKKEMPVDVRKPNAGVLCDESVLNKAEVKAEINSNMPTMPTVDLTYNATSTNAQSGKAVASALSTIPFRCSSTSVGSISASGSDVIAAGKDSVANGYYSAAYGTSAKGYTGGTAIGGYSFAGGSGYGTAIGFQAQITYGTYSIAIGYKPSVATSSSIAIGQNASVSGLGYYACAIGYQSEVTAYNGVAIGTSVKAKDNGCVVIGSFPDAFRDVQTLLYMISSGSPLANTYEDGAACLGYVVKQKDGTILECGTRKLSELLTNNTAFAPAGFEDGKEHTPFMPTGITDPIIEDIPEEN